jgi:LCP family protein required for cell wall assembly
MRMRSRRARILAWTSVSMVAILLVVVAGVYAAFRLELSPITRISPTIDTQHRPPRYNDALNILLLGSDTRTGLNARIGGRNGCACSDTIMIVHISPGRGGVTVVSIPRDTVVPLYACSPWQGLPGQRADPYAVERINATLAAGGPECVRHTVEQQAGIYINNVVALNFVGFQRVINDIGGVNVCLPFSINNVVTNGEGSGLDLKAGKHHINGRVALQFWRTRYRVADGSDIARISRDQYLMAQIVKGVLRSGLLGSPSKIIAVIGDVAHAMTTDASDTELLHIATSLRGLSAENVQFITAPWVSYPYNPNEVEFAQPQADAVFWAIAHDTAVPPTGKRKHHLRVETVKGQMNGPIGAGPTGQLMTLSPAQVKVTVLNGTSGADHAAHAAAALSSRGFGVLGTGYAASSGYRKSVIEYGGRADLAAARTVLGQFSSVKLKFVPGLPPGTVNVILGSSFSKLAPPKPTSRASIAALATDYGGIRASVSCRNSAFYSSNGTPQGQRNWCPCN